MAGGFIIAAAYAFAEQHGLAHEAAEIRNIPIHASLHKNAAGVRKGCFIELFESRGVIDDFVAQHWPARNTAAGTTRRAALIRRKAHNLRCIAGQDTVDNGEPDDEPSDELPAFALEAHLRDFIAGNLPLLTVSTQRIALYKDPAGRSGVEYPTDVGPIDILAVDSTGNFYVFELKLAKGPDKALGQLARYMGWIKVHRAAGKSVIGVIVANSIDEKLRYAAGVIPNTVLLEYQVSFRLTGIEPVTQSVPDTAPSTSFLAT